jgi:hypothetical protein
MALKGGHMNTALVRQIAYRYLPVIAFLAAAKFLAA